MPSLSETRVRCELSLEQACAFFRLFAHSGEIVPYRGLYQDLYGPFGGGLDGADQGLGRLLRDAVDYEVAELRRTLGMGGQYIERVRSPDGDERGPEGYRLTVS